MMDSLYLRFAQLKKTVDHWQGDPRVLMECYQAYRDLASEARHVMDLLHRVYDPDKHPPDGYWATSFAEKSPMVCRELRNFISFHLVEGLARMFFELGRHHYLCGKTERAFQVWRELLEVCPGHPELKAFLNDIVHEGG